MTTKTEHRLFFQHSSAVRLAGHAVLFTGPSGAGKTTVLRLLREAGCHGYGDELAVCQRHEDGRWMLDAMGSTRDGCLVRSTDHEPAPIGLMVHLRKHLPSGHAVARCTDLESVALGYQSIVLNGQHDPAVRTERFRTLSAFAREVPAVTLDFSLNAGFVPELLQLLQGNNAMTTMPVYARKPEVVLREETDDWALLFNPADGGVVGVNPMGVALWKLLEAPATVTAITAALRARCEDAPMQVEQEVAEYLERLASRGFLVVNKDLGSAA